MADLQCIVDEWNEQRELPMGTVMLRERGRFAQVMIVRSRACLCVYFGVPIKHPFAGMDYDRVPADCHGGVTFSARGDGDFGRDRDFWWYGWDYGHAGDRLMFPSSTDDAFARIDADFDRKFRPLALPASDLRQLDTRWTLSRVRRDAQPAVTRMIGLMNLAAIVTLGGILPRSVAHLTIAALEGSWKWRARLWWRERWKQGHAAGTRLRHLTEVRRKEKP